MASHVLREETLRFLVMIILVKLYRNKKEGFKEIICMFFTIAGVNLDVHDLGKFFADPCKSISLKSFKNKNRDIVLTVTREEKSKLKLYM